MSNTLQYIIVNISDLSLINFLEVIETNENTIRKNIAETQFVLKYIENKIPSFISNGSVIPDQTLNHTQALALMETSEWKSNTL